MVVCYVIDRGNILLGFKLVRIGAGLLNGPGGRQENGETIEETAARELLIETGLTALEMKKVAITLVVHEDNRQKLELHYYLITKHSGELRNAPDKNGEQEMFLGWCPLSTLIFLYGLMWPGDRFLLPKLLADKKCVGYFLYDSQKNKKLLKHKIVEVDVLPEHIANI